MVNGEWRESVVIDYIKVGKNIMMNRLTIINNKIDYKMMNLSKDTYKLKCKNVFLQ